MLTVQTFAGEEQAIEMANNTRFGLAATLVTGDPERAERVSARLNAGTVWVNCFFVRDLGAPFGGNGKSGHRPRRWRHSFDFYTDVKNTRLRAERLERVARERVQGRREPAQNRKETSWVRL